MPVSIVVPEKPPGQKSCDDEEEEHEFLDFFDDFFVFLK